MAVSPNLATDILIPAMDAFRKRATLARVGFSDLSQAANIAEQGDTVRITQFLRPGDPNDATMAVNHDATLVTPATRKLDLVVNRWKEYHWDVSMKDTADHGLELTYTQPARVYAAALADYMERDMFLSLLGGSGFVLASANPFSTSTDEIAGVRRRLVERDTYSENSVFFVRPSAAENLLKRPEFTNAATRGELGALSGATGLLGRRLGFQFVESNNIPSVNAGAAPAGMTAAAAPAGAIEIQVDQLARGGSAGPGISRGEIITLNGTIYGVNRGVEGASGTIELDRPLDAAVANNVNLNRAGGRPNFALDPSALAVVMRPTAPAVGEPATPTAPRSFTDPETGFSLSIQAAEIRHGYRYYISALWGSRVAIPEAVQRLG